MLEPPSYTTVTVVSKNVKINSKISSRFLNTWHTLYVCLYFSACVSFFVSVNICNSVVCFRAASTTVSVSPLHITKWDATVKSCSKKAPIYVSFQLPQHVAALPYHSKKHGKNSVVCRWRSPKVLQRWTSKI